MKRILIALSVFIFVFTGTRALGQEKKPVPQTSTSVSTDTERPKTEVDDLIQKVKDKGDIVLVRCVENCDGEGAIESGVEVGHVLALPQPKYPALARAAHVSGQVQVQLLIDVD